MRKEVLLALSFVFPCVLHAQQSNFQITPPPVPYPSFESGKKDLKLTGTYISLKGEGFKFTGGGADFSLRKAFNNRFALDGQFGMNVIGGELGSGTFSFKPVLLSMNFGGNMEYQFFNVPGGALVSYVGFLLPISILTFDKSFYIDFLGARSSITPDSITTIMYGIPVGVQASVQLGNWKLAPFGNIINYLGGSAFFKYRSIGPFTPASSFTIDGFVTTSFGTDILYVPWDLSIGSMLQEAAKSGKNEKVKTTIFQLTWRWRS